jgi:hypothetical protein
MKRFGAAGAAALLACSSFAADAATQGSLGATSTGTVGISATIPARAQITGLSDFTFGTLDPTTAASTSKNVCVWSNTGTKGYNITATGDGASSAFTLSNGSTTLAYGVEWAGSSNQSSGTALTTNTASTGFTSTAVNPTCSSSPTTTASLIVKFSTAQMQAAVGSATAYTGTLTLVVAPE